MEQKADTRLVKMAAAGSIVQRLQTAQPAVHQVRSTANVTVPHTDYSVGLSSKALERTRKA
jgi:hypothetical protein